MIKLKRLLEAHENAMPDPSLGDYILKHKVVTLSEWLYHGSPLDGLKEMLVHGIHGTEHGEVAEYDTFSTSINSEMLSMFSEGHGETGLSFKAANVKIVVLDDILAYLVTQLPGSGMDLDVDDEEGFQEFIRRFKVPVGSYKNVPYLPYDYLSGLGVDGFVYDYVWKRMERGMGGGMRDESEICFIGNGVHKLDHMISGIWVDGNEYEPSHKREALLDIENRL